MIVFDLLEVKTWDHAIAEGPRTVPGMMEKTVASSKTPAVGGFTGFPGGDPQKRVVDAARAKTACHACHAEGAAKSDLVFSARRD